MGLMKNRGYRITIFLAFAWTVLLPFLWAYHFSIEFGLPSDLAFLAYRAELVAVPLCAVVLIGAWLLKSWAIPGLCIGALGFPLLKLALAGAPTDAWVIGSILFTALALRLRILLKRYPNTPGNVAK
jgi:hypothetical protein